MSCEESNRYQVNRDMTRELFLVMKENNIKVPFNQISIVEEKK